MVFDGETAHPHCQVGWGFSCYMREARLLFDTGEDPYKLGNNLQVLGIPASDIHHVVFSHGHFDHVRGVMALKNAAPRILVPPGLLDPAFHKALLEKGFVVSAGNGSGPILPGIFRITVAQGGMMEQALIVRGKQGWCILFGCAHWGVDHWIQTVRSRCEGPIDLVMGGYHLLDARPGRIQDAIDGFLSMGVQRVAPCHCAGPKARRLFREAFGEGYLDLKVGEAVEV